MAGHAKRKAVAADAEDLWQDREAEGLRCLSVLDGENPGQLATSGSPSQLADSDSPNQLAGFTEAPTEQNEETVLAHARDWAEQFLRTLARRGTILAAYREAGVSRAHVYRLMDASPTFRRAVEVAREEFVEHLEEVAVRRAEGGSDRMLEVLLRAASPKYREAQQAVNISVGSPIVVDVIEAPAGQPVDDVV